jgi:hypothetical protein
MQLLSQPKPHNNHHHHFISSFHPYKFVAEKAAAFSHFPPSLKLVFYCPTQLHHVFSAAQALLYLLTIDQQ